MRRVSSLACALIGLAFTAVGGEAQGAKKPPIADNSFLMEEAYNQEPGVIQHISLFQKSREGSMWMYGFTQEWPVKGQKNQFSFTLPYTDFGGNGPSGLGDVMLNWRYQWKGSESDATWISPRFSLSLPTGDEKKFLGTGGLGYEFAVPVSHRWNDEWVSHTNVGLSLQPSAKAFNGADMSSTEVALGHSFIWQPKDRLNFMLETVWSTTHSKIGSSSGDVSGGYISPGLRWGYDFSSGLQIVPGIALPIGFGDFKEDKQILLYLSFEHPLKKQ